MSTIAEGHEWQQGPVEFGGRVEPVLSSEPGLNLRAPRMVEADHGDKRCEADGRRRSWFDGSFDRGKNGMGPWLFVGGRSCFDGRKLGVLVVAAEADFLHLGLVSHYGYLLLRRRNGEMGLRRTRKATRVRKQCYGCAMRLTIEAMARKMSLWNAMGIVSMRG